jgi:hypothetical protein
MGGATPRSSSHGRITSGLAPRTLVDKTLDFVRSQLPSWRDDPHRPSVESEEALNGQLCKFLDVICRRELPMVHFHHEERQGGRRRVDLSALSAEPTTIGAQKYSIYDPFLVLEGKRLPAPSTAREREYVTGFDERNGGIQRFKLGLHGADLKVAAIIGYLQDGTADDWHRTINDWITELAQAKKTQHDHWTPRDRLQAMKSEARRCISACRSVHARPGAARSMQIVLHHLWIEL